MCYYFGFVLDLFLLINYGNTGVILIHFSLHRWYNLKTKTTRFSSDDFPMNNFGTKLDADCDTLLVRSGDTTDEEYLKEKVMRRCYETRPETIEEN